MKLSAILTSLLASMSSAIAHQASLAPFKFNHFPLGSIRPGGWLRDQIQLSADGLGGHLFDFYRYVARSTWLGGSYEYSELHESAPYWFNYIVPLAWTLDDPRLKKQARQFLDYVLDNQADDGWLGPETTRQTRGIWARSLLAFGLIQYAEADESQEQRIVDSMHRFTKLVRSMLKDNFTGLLQDKSQEDNFDPFGFGLSRTHELPISLMWLYENHPRDNGDVILETIDLMFEGGRVGGRDWTKFFVKGVFPEDANFKTSGFTHGVNLAQGLRYPTVLYRRNSSESLVQQTFDAVNMTATYHTSLSGSIIGDEHISNLSPQRGSELCMAVESMFSYAYLYRFHGANEFADRAELAAFNAFPAAISPDWWSHQYVTQTNEPWSRNLTGNPFFNVVSYANTYGLEPNFPCCTVNHPQGYPKYVASSYVYAEHDKIAHILLGPTSLETKLQGKRVKVECDTHYPFSSILQYTITTETSFEFGVRVPNWTTHEATAQVGRQKPRHLSPDSNGVHYTKVLPGVTKVIVELPMDVHIVSRNETVGVYYGPMLYAADIAHKESAHQPLNWTDRTPLDDSETHPKAMDHVLEPISQWKFAIDPETISVDTGPAQDRILPNPIFSRGGPPVLLYVDAYPIDWPIQFDTAALPPINPEVNPETKTRIKLIPYGAAKLHIAQFPVARLPKKT